MLKWTDRRMILLYAAVLCGLFFIYKVITPVVFGRNIQMTITKQKGKIETLDTPVVSDFKEIYYINTIDFPGGSVLVHKDLGNFAYAQDFFLDFNAKIEILKDGIFLFDIASDDGFRFKLNGNMIGEFISNRPFETNQYSVLLNKGIYNMDLFYYQGFGLLGLIAAYRFQEGGRTYLFGEDSPYMRFKRE